MREGQRRQGEVKEGGEKEGQGEREVGIFGVTVLLSRN